MAIETLTKVQAFQAPVFGPDPTPDPSSADAGRDKHDRPMTHAVDTKAEEIGPPPRHQFSQPTSNYPDTEQGWSTQTSLGDYAGSTPIDVPRPKSGGGGQWAIDNSFLGNGTAQNGSYDDIQVEEFLRNRRPSITFSPEVTLDTGDRRNLDSPLPKLALDTKPIDKLAFKELERYPPRPAQLHRTYSEADIQECDPATGKHLDHLPSIFDGPAAPTQSSPFDFRGRDRIPTEQPIKQPKLDSVNVDEAPSLTSDATISPILEEAQTPPDNMEIIASPISAFPPFHYPTSYEDSSAWPKQRHRTSSRNNPFLERASSLRSSRRPTTRRSTSSSMSPASNFLSRFAPRSESPPSPDSEGQVVGEYVLGKQLGFGGFSVVKEAFTIEGDARITRAAKIVRKQLHGRDEAENDRLQAEFEHEVQIWRCLGHRNILPLIEVYDTSFATFCFTKINTGGTLFDKIRSNRSGLPTTLAKRYAYQLASAIRYLHEDVHVVHRDIKLENCLLDTSDPETADEGGKLLLCDFGLAEFVANDMRSSSPDPYDRHADRIASHHSSDMTTNHNIDGFPQPTNGADSTSHPPARNGGISDRPPLPHSPSDAAISIAGSLQYASPELIIAPAGFLSPVVDIWAYGVVCYAMCVGDLPFQHVFQPRVSMMVLRGEWDATKLTPRSAGAGRSQTWNGEADRWVKDGTRADRAHTLSVGGKTGVVEMEEDVDEAGRLDLVTGCLDMSSDARWNIGQVLNSRWLRGMQEMLEEREGGFKL